MKDYKRLTERITASNTGRTVLVIPTFRHEIIEQTKRLAELEDKIESGELCDREESEWKHQAEVLRLALSKSVLDENAIFDDDVCRYILSNTRLTEEYYIEQAEKELQEEWGDE